MKKSFKEENIYYNKPCAIKGLISYRYINGKYGYIMIGAKDDDDAINEANRSLTYPNANINNLEKWSGSKYEKILQND